MVATGEVTFNGITMRGFGPPDPGFYFTSIIDWFTVPEAKTQVRERPNADGAFGFTTDWRQASTPSLEGVYIGSTREDVGAAKRQLQAAARGALVPFTFTDEDGPTTRMVSVRSLPIPDDHGQLHFTFAIDMLAPDPNRYGGSGGASDPQVEVVATGLPVGGTGMAWKVIYPIDWGTASDPGRITVHNPGTQPTFSIFTVSGGLDGGFEIVELAGGRRLRFERVVPLGSLVTLDPRTGRASIDGANNDVTGYLTVREWWSVPPGGSQELQFNGIGAPSGTPTLTARTAPAY